MAQISRVKSWKSHPVAASAQAIETPRQARRSKIAKGRDEDGFRIIHDGYYWRVEGPDGSVSGGHSSMASADVRLGEMARAARAARAVRQRCCMTCEREFTSEGIHNRMCPDCRHRGYQPATGW